MLQRLRFETREEWLEGRQRQGFGGSDAAAVVGLSPWMSPLELWKTKMGVIRPKDIGGNAAVAQGVRMEPILRDFYLAEHPEYRGEYHPYDILYQAERPWLFATLDGMLFTEEGRSGILEIKTGTPKGKEGWSHWANGQMPEQYFVQVAHQLLATGYDFVRLFACLYSANGDKTLKEYEIEREDVEEDLAWLLEEETRFYERYIIGGLMPPTPLAL